MIEFVVGAVAGAALVALVPAVGNAVKAVVAKLHGPALPKV